MPFERNAQGDLLAWPGAGFAHRPPCVVVSVHGRYQGCGSWAFTVEGAAVQPSDVDRAWEVLLRYPDGMEKWFPGPLAHVNGRCRPMDVPELVEYELVSNLTEGGV